MGENWGWRRWAFAVFSGIMLLHIVAILLFTRGFLLTRTELSQYSQCSDVFQSPCLSPLDLEPKKPEKFEEKNGTSNDYHRNQTVMHPQGQVCWNKPAVDRVIIIILDALRLLDLLFVTKFFNSLVYIY